ncbi:MAG: flagellar protein FlaG [Methylococcaceae bacterium]|jgi:flagellar protein FlaG
MSGEISNISTSASVAVIKSDKRTQDDNASLNANTALEGSAVANTVTIGNESSRKQAAGQSLKVIKSATDTGNSYLQAVNRNLEFKVDDSTREVVVKVVDSTSGKVVRQIPSEEILAFIKRLKDLDGQNGSILQDRA